MRNFIRNTLANVRNRNMETFDYQHKRDNKDIIIVKGCIKNKNADFVIERIKANGYRCSSISVYEMPLTDKCIEQIIEIAVEGL